MSFLKKPLLSRVIEALKDTEKLKTPIVVKKGDTMQLEIARLERLLAQAQSIEEKKKIEQQIKFFEIGQAGERSLMFELENSFLPMMILHDVYIEHKGFNAQFDFILITRKFFLVIEVKKYYGNITVNEKGEFIRTVNRGNRTVFKEGIYSPIRQVDRQVEVLRNMLVDHEIIKQTPIHSVVAFANEKTVIDLKKAPANIKNRVVRVDGIVSFLEAELAKKSPVHFLDKRMQDYATYIKDQHIDKHVEEIVDEEEQRIFAEDVMVVKEGVKIESSPVNLKDGNLERVLKDFRMTIANETGYKAFHVFTNKTLDELIVKKPTTIKALRDVTGIGDKKIEAFGKRLIQVIIDYI